MYVCLLQSVQVTVTFCWSLNKDMKFCGGTSVFVVMFEPHAPTGPLGFMNTWIKAPCQCVYNPSVLLFSS